MCFTKYLIGVDSQNLINCHQLVGVNSHAEENIATGRPALALVVGCTGKAQFGVSSRLHWAIRLGLGSC